MEKKSHKRGPIVSFGGKMGCGKDTAADFLVEIAAEHKMKFVNMRFAGKLRECVEVLTAGVIKAVKTYTSAEKAAKIPEGAFGDTLYTLIIRMLSAMGHALGKKLCIGPLHVEDAHSGLAPDLMPVEMGTIIKAVSIVTGTSYAADTPRLTKVTISPEMTVGRLLQLLGTDVGRDLFGDTIWIDAVERDWRAAGCPPAAFRDQRFPNEFAWIERNAGFPYLIDADKRLASAASLAPTESPVTAKDGRSTAHVSETSLGGIPRDKFVAVIENNGTLEELKRAMRAVWDRLDIP